ncbi:hypothetical protein KP509_16G011300 [Ceratopteris richardii]|uniref:Ceramidase n=1 Tax=Ceratopteris richardii TaxID=49495 RepID=A0A8T2SY66_CERRI|nr:hypothetical protein KP509_16G011300 [Ceratopteris richardii]
MVKMLQVAMNRLSEHRGLASGTGLVCFVLLMLLTPRIPQPQSYHKFSDQRNLIGVPNSMNVISNFPFLIIGVIGLVLSLHGNYLGLSLKGEVWCWASFYVGVTATAFGSAYYHLKPNDARLVWDRLPMAIAVSSILAVFIIERIDERKGTAALFPLLLAGVLSIIYWRFGDDLRPYTLLQFVSLVAILSMTIALPPKYTHSLYWVWAAGWFFLGMIEELLDRKLYRWTNHSISGHTMKHFSFVMIPVFMTVMLARRNIKIERES